MPKESPRGVPLSRLAFLIATCRFGREVPAGQAAPHAGPSGERVRLNPRRREQARGRRPSIGRLVGSPVGDHGHSAPACEFSGSARRLRPRHGVLLPHRQAS